MSNQTPKAEPFGLPVDDDFLKSRLDERSVPEMLGAPKAEARDFFGRTEYMCGADGVRKLAFAIYEGRERDGYLKKSPIGWMIEHRDAKRFLYDFDAQAAELQAAREEIKRLKNELFYMKEQNA